MPRPKKATRVLRLVASAPPLPQDVKEALDGYDDLLLDDDRTILTAIANLTNASRPCTSLSAVAASMGWCKGRRITLGIRRLYAKGLIYYVPGVANSLLLTDHGYHALDRLSHSEEQWREGYATGRASVLAEMQVVTSDHTTVATTLLTASH